MDTNTIFKGMRAHLCHLWNNWQHERKGASFTPYAAKAKDRLAEVAPGATFISMRAKPFALTYQMEGHTYKISVTASRYSIRRLM